MTPHKPPNSIRWVSINQRGVPTLMALQFYKESNSRKLPFPILCWKDSLLDFLNNLCALVTFSNDYVTGNWVAEAAFQNDKEAGSKQLFNWHYVTQCALSFKYRSAFIRQIYISQNVPDLKRNAQEKCIEQSGSDSFPILTARVFSFKKTLYWNGITCATIEVRPETREQ